MKSGSTEGWEMKWEVMGAEFQLGLIWALPRALQAKASVLVLRSSAESREQRLPSSTRFVGDVAD